MAVCSASSDPVWGKNAIPRFWRVSINIPLAVVQHCHHCQHGDMLPLLSAAHCCGVAALQLRGTKYQVLSDGDVQQPALRPGPRHHSLLCHITGYWVLWILAILVSGTRAAFCVGRSKTRCVDILLILITWMSNRTNNHPGPTRCTVKIFMYL